MAKPDPLKEYEDGYYELEPEDDGIGSVEDDEASRNHEEDDL